MNSHNQSSDQVGPEGPGTSYPTSKKPEAPPDPRDGLFTYQWRFTWRYHDLEWHAVDGTDECVAYEFQDKGKWKGYWRVVRDGLEERRGTENTLNRAKKRAERALLELRAEDGGAAWWTRKSEDPFQDGKDPIEGRN